MKSFLGSAAIDRCKGPDMVSEPRRNCSRCVQVEVCGVYLQNPPVKRKICKYNKIKQNDFTIDLNLKKPTFTRYISFSRQNASKRTFCICVAGSCWRDGAIKQNKASPQVTESRWIEGNKPTVRRFSEFACRSIDLIVELIHLQK